MHLNRTTREIAKVEVAGSNPVVRSIDPAESAARDQKCCSRAAIGGEGTGKSPVDRGKLGWKWSVAVNAAGIPIGWAIDGANRNDVKLLEPTLDAVVETGLLADIDTICLDRSYDYPAIRALNTYGLDDLDIQKRGTKPKPGEPHRLTLGLRWVVEATNSWWSNYGQLRRNTDRRNRHRHALRLATTVLIIGRLIDHRDRWNPNSRPIR